MYVNTYSVKLFMRNSFNFIYYTRYLFSFIQYTDFLDIGYGVNSFSLGFQLTIRDENFQCTLG